MGSALDIAMRLLKKETGENYDPYSEKEEDLTNAPWDLVLAIQEQAYSLAEQNTPWDKEKYPTYHDWQEAIEIEGEMNLANMMMGPEYGYLREWYHQLGKPPDSYGKPTFKERDDEIDFYRDMGLPPPGESFAIGIPGIDEPVEIPNHPQGHKENPFKPTMYEKDGEPTWPAGTLYDEETGFTRSKPMDIAMRLLKNWPDEDPFELTNHEDDAFQGLKEQYETDPDILQEKWEQTSMDECPYAHHGANVLGTMQDENGRCLNCGYHEDPDKSRKDNEDIMATHRKREGINPEVHANEDEDFDDWDKMKYTGEPMDIAMRLLKTPLLPESIKRVSDNRTEAQFQDPKTNQIYPMVAQEEPDMRYMNVGIYPKQPGQNLGAPSGLDAMDLTDKDIDDDVKESLALGLSNAELSTADLIGDGHDDDNYWESSMTWTDPEKRRRGYASALYDLVNELGERKVRPSGNQSDDGKQFWSKRMLPKGEPMEIAMQLLKAMAGRKREVAFGPGKRSVFKVPKLGVDLGEAIDPVELGLGQSLENIGLPFLGEKPVRGRELAVGGRESEYKPFVTQQTATTPLAGLWGIKSGQKGAVLPAAGFTSHRMAQEHGLHEKPWWDEYTEMGKRFGRRHHSRNPYAAALRAKDLQPGNVGVYTGGGGDESLRVFDPVLRNPTTRGSTLSNIRQWVEGQPSNEPVNQYQRAMEISNLLSAISNIGTIKERDPHVSYSAHLEPGYSVYRDIHRNLPSTSQFDVFSESAETPEQTKQAEQMIRDYSTFKDRFGSDLSILGGYIDQPLGDQYRLHDFEGGSPLSS